MVIAVKDSLYLSLLADKGLWFLGNLIFCLFCIIFTWEIMLIAGLHIYMSDLLVLELIKCDLQAVYYYVCLMANRFKYNTLSVLSVLFSNTTPSFSGTPMAHSHQLSTPRLAYYFWNI